MDKKSRCLNCGSSRLHMITTSHNIFCRDCCATYPMSKYANAPAPSQPCKWYKQMTDWNNCKCPDGYYVCPGHAACEHYEPKGEERKVPCKHLYADVICFRSGLRCDDRYKACEQYEPAVAPAATGRVSGHKFDTIIYDDVQHIAPLGKEFHDAMKRFVADVKTPKHYKCSTGLVGNIIGDTRPDDVMMWIESPRIDSKVMIEYLAKMDDIVKRIMNKTNKEDIDMSGNAYFCDSCRGTFPRNEVMVMNAVATRTDRRMVKVAEDSAHDFTICTTCYTKYREAVAPFNFPWDEWRKGDDDEG